MNFVREIAVLSADLCLKIAKNWVQRLDFCKHAMQKKSSFIHNGSERTFPKPF